MSAGDPRDEVVRYWWETAEKSLAAARRECEADALAFAVNRLYNAAFYAASAVLLRRGVHFKKHAGARIAFHRELVRAGVLEKKWGKLYDQLFGDRHEVDYLALVSFERAYVQEQIAQCEELLRVPRPLVS